MKKLLHKANDGKHDIVQRLRQRLGDDAVLLAIAPLGKNPIEKGWQRFTPAKMSNQEYLETLSQADNIGVLLGKNSGGLCTIDIDDDASMEPFLALNPKLASALRTKRKRGGNFWLRVDGAFPPSTKIKTKAGVEFGEWRADGNQTMIHGQAIDRKKGEKEPTRYRIVKDGPVVKLQFEEIKWPEELITPWLEQPAKSDALEALQTEYGQPFYNDEDGAPSDLNEPFWAALYAMENHILYEPTAREFLKYDERDGIYRVILLRQE